MKPTWHKKGETWLSLAILALLTGIGSGIFFQQFHFNPAVSRGVPSQPREMPPSVRPAKTLVTPPSSMTALSDPENFRAPNLFQKINGKAELYLSAGFRELRSQIFQDAADANFWMEIFIYDMGGSANAFSVFSTQRRSGAPELGLTRHGYRTSNGVFLVHGPYYVEIIASEPSDRAAGLLQAAAENFVKQNPIAQGALTEEDVFPEPGLVKNSTALIAADAFGAAMLDRVWTAVYEIQGSRATAFLSRRQSAAEAAGLARDYRAFLLEFGGRELAPGVDIPGAGMVEILETFELVFSHGPFLAGVRESSHKAGAQMLAARLYERLQEVRHGP